MKLQFYSREWKLANKVRKIGLNTKDIQNVIKDLKSIEKEVNSLPKDIENILDEAVNYCQSITPISDKDGNHLRYNTYWEKTPTGYRIVQEGDSVAYVEFGTGVAKYDVTHPKSTQFGWAYGVGSHIFITKEGKTGWFYPTNVEGKNTFRFTEGQKANMQMYKTGIWLEKRLGVMVKMKMKRVNENWLQ